MKKALLLCFGLLLLAAAHVQAAPANVNFASERGVPFNLRFDGRIMTRGGARQVHLNRVAPGLHWADFQIPVGYGRFINYRTRVFLDPGLETNFVLLTRPGRGPELRKVSAVPVRGGCGPGYGYGGPDGGGYYGGEPGGYQGSGNDDYDDADEPYYGNNQPPVGPNNGGGYGNGGFYPGGGVSYNRAMSPQDVQNLAQALDAKSFDSGKLTVAKEALGHSYINAADLKGLVEKMSFESSKVELAKFAHPRVADPQNFYQVYDAFTFDSSVRDVQKAVGAPGRD